MIAVESAPRARAACSRGFSPFQRRIRPPS